MQRSNRKPLPTVSRERHLPHAVAVIVCPPSNLTRWLSVLRRWAPGLNTATLDESSPRQAVRAALDAFVERLESADAHTAVPPCDVLLVCGAAVCDETLAVLERVPWLLAIIEDCSSIGRVQFSAWRRVLARAHQRIALEFGDTRATDSQSLRNLIEVVQPQLVDCRQGNMLTLATCASPSAEKVRRAPVLAMLCAGMRSD